MFEHAVMEVYVVTIKFVALALAIAIPSVARADDKAPIDKLRLSADFDLALWASKGHAFWLGVAPGPHWKLMLGTVSGELPSFALPSGWNGRSLAGTGIMAQYAFGADGTGPFVGAVALKIQWRYARTDMPDIEGDRDQLILAAVVGYTWFPAHNGFYVQPLLGVGKGLFTHGTVTLGGETYNDKIPIAILPAVFVGWQWGR